MTLTKQQIDDMRTSLRLGAQPFSEDAIDSLCALAVRALSAPTEVAPTWDTAFVAWLRKETPITFAAFCNQFDDERRRDEPQSPL